MLDTNFQQYFKKLISFNQKASNSKKNGSKIENKFKEMSLIQRNLCKQDEDLIHLYQDTKHNIN